MPHRDIKDGDEIFIRARAITTCSDAIQAEIANYPKMVVTQWVPASECARAEDIGRLLPRRRARTDPPA